MKTLDSDRQTSANSKTDIKSINSTKWTRVFNRLQTRSPTKKSVNFIPQDNIERYCPLDIPNKFLFDATKRFKLRSFINGQQSPEDLVRDLNRVDVKKNLFARPKKSSVKFLQFLCDDRVIQKLKVQQRFDVIRKVIDQNKKSKETARIQVHLQDSRLFQQISQHCEDHVARINSHDLLTSRTDGQRKYNSCKLKQYRSSPIKLKVEAETNENTKNQIYTKQLAQIEVNQHAYDYFRRMEEQNFVKDQQTKRKAKLKIMHQRKKQQASEFIEYERHRSEPFLKDIQLFNFIHGESKNQPNQIQSQRVSRETSVQKQRVHHQLANFKDDDLMIENDQSNDQSLESMKELQITSLYEQSRYLQKRLIDEQRIVRKLQHSKQLDILTDQIQKNNNMKLLQ
ncbi:hypothetical protein pb186bvf_012375 [Paramecium bursaria]